jgi:predicted nucleic acid-binding protein
LAEPVLVDTSVWIDFFGTKETKECKLLYNYIADDQPVMLCPPVIQEILQGIRSDSDYEEIKESILSFDILNVDPVEAAIGSADLYRLLRKRGVTIKKSNDCLIAYYAIYFKVALLHRDYEFDLIAKHLPLKTKH